MDLVRDQGSGWVPSMSHALVVSMLLLAAVHLRLTKSDVYLGLAALRQQIRQHSKVLTQRELDRQHRFEAELLRVRIDVCDGVRRVGIHIVFAYSLSIMQQLLTDPRSSCMQLLAPLVEYALHTLLQTGYLKIKTWNHFRMLRCVWLCGYAACAYAVANEMDYERFCAMEKLSAAALMVQSVVFLDCKVTVPVYIFGAAVVTLKHWHWTGFVLPSLVWHVAFVGMMTCVVFAMQYHIAAKLESDDVSSLLASRCVLRGVCDGDVVLDCRTHRILEDSTSLERLLNVKRKLSGSNFLDLFLDADGRQQFLQFLQSEALPQQRKAAIPPCWRIVLQGAHGPVSTDVFCTSCAAAGQDFYLLALRADPDQFGIPPDAPDPPQSAAWQFDQEQQQPKRQPSEGNSSVEVAEAFRELMQVRLLVNIDTPRLDIEEATLSFSRSRHRDGMPTLRSFVSINDWDRVEDLFRSAKESFKAGGAQVWRFPSPLLFRIPGSRPRSYLRARSAVVTVGDEDEDEESQGPPAFEFHLTTFDLKHSRQPREQDLESIGEDGE